MVRSKLVKEGLAGFNAEGVGVLCEVTVLEHIVDVIPGNLEGNAKLAVVVHYLFSLAPVLVTLCSESAHSSETT